MNRNEQLVYDYYSEQPDHWLKPYELELGNISSRIKSYLHDYLQSVVEFEFSSIEQISKTCPSNLLAQDLTGGVNQLTQHLYNVDHDFYLLYQELCQKIGSYFSPDEYVIQKQPTIRLHSSVHYSHFYPFWHSDLFLGHPVGTTNLWIPLTSLSPSSHDHGFSICSPHETHQQYLTTSSDLNPYEFLDSNDFTKSETLTTSSTPVLTKPGNMCVFDSRLFHSAMPHFDHCRLSIDIRVIKRQFLSDPYPIFTGLGRRKALFNIGNYYCDFTNVF